MKEKTRNYNIDFLRGIATLCIILIHTAWWSGQEYLPEWFSNLCLIIDVPVFMFIAGISFNYVNSIIKNIKGLLNNWKKWLYFLLFYILFILIFFREQFVITDLFSWIVYIFPNSNNIQVVPGSIWFMKMYINVSIICSIIICSINYFVKENKLKALKTIIGIMLFIFLYCSENNSFLFFDRYISFYSLIYLIGYYLNNYKIKDIKKLIIYEIINFVVLITIFMIMNLTINDIQNIKFPPSLPYLSFSMISILLFWYLKDNLNIKASNKINYIGKNAIFFYFAQGVSSSFIYYIYKYIPFSNKIIIFIIMLLCNILFATIFAVILDKTYKLFSEKLKSSKLKKYLFQI
jgi:hypothetical protein